MIAENPEYVGTTYHMVELKLLGIFSMIPNEVWFDLGGSFLPWVGLGDSVNEVGESSQNIGAGAHMGLRYRLPDGLSIGLALMLDFVFYDPQGEGRSGRIGDSARDQIISINLELGWMSEPDVRTPDELELSAPPTFQESPQLSW